MLDWIAYYAAELSMRVDVHMSEDREGLYLQSN